MNPNEPNASREIIEPISLIMKSKNYTELNKLRLDFAFFLSEEDDLHFLVYRDVRSATNYVKVA